MDTPTNGASNAADFQPPTRNPQAALTQLFQQQGGVQPSVDQDILRDSTVKITVPVNPAPPPAAVTEAKDAGWLVFVIIIIVVGLALVWWRRRRMAAVPVSSPHAETPPEPAKAPERVISQAPIKPPRSPKAIAKAKRSKKRKRSRR